MDCGGRGCICIILKTLGYISNFSQEQKKESKNYRQMVKFRSLI